MKPLSLAVLIGLCLGGCVANKPTDVVFSSIHLANWRDEAELPAPKEHPARGLVSDRQLLSLRQMLEESVKSDRPLLKVYFFTAMDFSKFATENSFNLMNTTFFCDRPETSPYMSFPSVYQNGARVGDAKIFGQPVNGFSGEYYIFIDVSRPRVVPSKPPQNGYDLRNENGDLCFQLAGGSGFRGFRSNVVAIPRRAIDDVLVQMEYETQP